MSIFSSLKAEIEWASDMLVQNDRHNNIHLLYLNNNELRNIVLAFAYNLLA